MCIRVFVADACVHSFERHGCTTRRVIAYLVIHYLFCVVELLCAPLEVGTLCATVSGSVPILCV